MRLAKPTSETAKTPRFDWWSLAAILIAVLAVIGFRVGSILVWGATNAIFAIPTALVLLLMFTVPGAALLRWLWPDPLEAIEFWPLSIGLSCATLPLVLLLGSLIGLQLNSVSAWLFLVICAVLACWPRKGQIWSARIDPRNWPKPANDFWLLLGIFIVALIVRLFVIRDLPVGLWGDSYQHTMIAQLLYENGGIFSSWEPYARLASFTYHYGFHSLVAWLAWLAGVPTTQGLMLIGQVENAFTIPLIYLFTRRLFASSRAGLWAALLAGFVGQMPVVYVNWGRYTQLGGQTILPVAIVCWMLLLDRAIEANRTTRQLSALALLTAIITGGIAVTHYRVGVYLATFVAVYALAIVLRAWRTPELWLRAAGMSLAAGIGSLIIAGPWILRLREGALLKLGGQFISNDIGTTHTNEQPALTEVINNYISRPIFALIILAIILIVVQRRWQGWVLIGWGALTWLAANPFLIGLPGAGILTSFAVLIAIYLLTTPLAGYTMDQLARLTERFSFTRAWLVPAQCAFGAIVICWGLSWQQHLAGANYQLFTKADLAAVEWIRNETPADARLFVNSFQSYSGSLYAGSDGGWWLGLLSGRDTSLPPLTYGSEIGTDPLFYRKTNDEITRIMEAPAGSQESAEALKAAGYDYLYNGPMSNGIPEDQEYVNADRLAGSAWFELVYDQDGVTIWKVR